MIVRTLARGAAALALSGAAATAATALAADRPDFGKREYEANCALCHGADGRSGAYVEFLKVTPPDLAQLARRNGGVFPLERVYNVIDGRQAVRAHGTRDMPIWGRDYLVRVGETSFDTPYDPEAMVRSRILSLVDYLNRIQAK
ncbi:MAG TPA: hypothetical protein PLP74_16755 [Quisquiliibacterium sp.]|nr:hypothetical protein [Quisquiliibacterium sp.]